MGGGDKQLAEPNFCVRVLRWIFRPRGATSIVLDRIHPGEGSGQQSDRYGFDYVLYRRVYHVYERGGA